jgi:hypothetical protein
VSLPQLPLPTFVLTLVYAAAIAVAVAQPGRNTLAGLVVLAGLTTRWLAHRRAGRIAVRPAEPVPAPAVAT